VQEVLEEIKFKRRKRKLHQLETAAVKVKKLRTNFLLLE